MLLQEIIDYTDQNPIKIQRNTIKQMDSEFEDVEKMLSVKESSKNPITRVRQMVSMFNYITLEKNNGRTTKRQRKSKTNYR